MKRRAGAGFTLVEVALAFGILAFSLAAICGALSLGMATTGAAERETVLAAIHQQVMSELRAAPFDAHWLADPLTGATILPPPNLPPENSDYYFTQEGRRLPNEPPPTRAAYLCTVEKRADEETRDFGGTTVNLLNLRLHVQWPASLPAEQRESRIFHAQVARF